MAQRFKWLGALTLAALGLAVVPAEAQVNATIVSKSGERTSGQLLDHGGVGFTIRVNGEERRIPTNQVAIVEFTGGPMSAADWTKVSEGSHAVWLKSGEVVTGQFYDIGGTAPLISGAPLWPASPIGPRPSAGRRAPCTGAERGA